MLHTLQLRSKAQSLEPETNWYLFSNESMMKLMYVLAVFLAAILSLLTALCDKSGHEEQTVLKSSCA